MVITSRSTVNSVFFLILDFISVGCLFIMVGAALRNDNFNRLRRSSCCIVSFCCDDVKCCRTKQSWLIGKIYSHSFRSDCKCFNIFRTLVVIGGWKYKDNLMSSSTLSISKTTNTHELGSVMYTDYILYFTSGNSSSTSNDRSNFTYFQRKSWC